jgi:hypothetical protein
MTSSVGKKKSPKLAGVVLEQEPESVDATPPVAAAAPASRHFLLLDADAQRHIILALLLLLVVSNAAWWLFVDKTARCVCHCGVSDARLASVLSALEAHAQTLPPLTSATQRIIAHAASVSDSCRSGVAALTNATRDHGALLDSFAHFVAWHTEQLVIVRNSAFRQMMVGADGVVADEVARLHAALNGSLAHYGARLNESLALARKSYVHVHGLK